MKSSSAVRAQVESALAGRMASPFRLREYAPPELAPSGVAALDELCGGLPRGAITELLGPASSGRTTILLAALAAATRRGEAAALVDTSDALHPASAAAAGVDLTRLLWVRCGPGRAQPASKTHIPRAPAPSRARSPRAGFAPDGAPGKASAAGAARHRDFRLLEQALRATDLILQGGGFGLVALDLADIPAPAARRVPLATWFRFRRAVENTPAALLVIAPEPEGERGDGLSWGPAGGTCAALALRLRCAGLDHLELGRVTPAQERGGGPDGAARPSPARLLCGTRFHVEVLRSPAARRKPAQPAPAELHSRAAWAV